MLTAGEVLQDRYRIIRPIGVGGMGAVYEGENILIRRRVAIKVMHGSGLRRPEMTARFEREAQIVNQIHSDHVVEVLDLGFLSSGDPFIVMEYLEGQTLSDRIGSGGKMAPEQLVPLLCQVLRALQAAHDAGVVHRDIKPDNVFLLGSHTDPKTAFVKLLDFGISKVGDTSGEPNITVTGATIGTPAFMAPEQIGGGERVGPAADLYAVGVVLYRGLTGQPPFASDRINELLTQIGQGGAKPIHIVNSELDTALSSIVQRAMHIDPVERFSSADDMRTALTGWLRGTHPKVSPHGPPDSYGQPLAQSAPPSAASHSSRSGQSSVAPAVRTTSTTPRHSWTRKQIALGVFAVSGLMLALWTRSPGAPESGARAGAQSLPAHYTAPDEATDSTPPSAPTVQVLPPEANGPLDNPDPRPVKSPNADTPTAGKPSTTKNKQPDKEKAPESTSSDTGPSGTTPTALPPDKAPDLRRSTPEHDAHRARKARRSRRPHTTKPPSRAAAVSEEIQAEQQPPTDAPQQSPGPAPRVDWGY